MSRREALRAAFLCAALLAAGAGFLRKQVTVYDPARGDAAAGYDGGYYAELELGLVRIIYVDSRRFGRFAECQPIWTTSTVFYRGRAAVTGRPTRRSPGTPSSP